MRFTSLTASSSWAQRAAIQLVTHRAQQLEWMRSFDFQQYLEGWIGASPVRNHLRGETAQADISQGLITQWQEGLNLVVSPAAAAAMFSAADALRGAVMPAMDPTDLPTQVGAMLLPRTLYATGGFDTRVGFSALSWSPCGIGPDRLGVFVTTWTHRDAEEDTMIRQRRWQTVSNQAPLGQPPTPHYLLRSMDPMVFGQDYGLGERPTPLPDYHRMEAEGTMSLSQTDGDPDTFAMRLIYSAWELMRQGQITLTAVSLPPRSRQLFAQEPYDFPVVGLDVAEHLQSSVLTARRRQIVEAGSNRVRHLWSLRRPPLVTPH